MNYGISVLFRAIPLLMGCFCFMFGSYILILGGPDSAVPGRVVFALGMICIALYSTAAVIIRQLIGKFHPVLRFLLPGLGYSAGLATIIYALTLLAHESVLSSDVVSGHVVFGVGLITMCVATAALSSIRFKLISENSSKPLGIISEKAYSKTMVYILISIVTVISLIGWIWTIVLLTHAENISYFVAGHVMAGLAAICTSLIALVVSLTKQTRNEYNQFDKKFWHRYVLTIASLLFLWALAVIFMYEDSAHSSIGFIMIGLSLVCYSISSKIILLSRIWKSSFELANRIPIIPVMTALLCLFLASFLFEREAFDSSYFIPARVLAGLGAICFTLFSIVSILESGSKK